MTTVVMTCLILLQAEDNIKGLKGDICLKTDGTIEVHGDMHIDAAAHQFWNYVKERAKSDPICQH